MNPCHLYFHLYMYLHKWTHSPVINDLYIYIKPCDLITLVSDMCAWPEAPDGNGLSVADASLSAGLGHDFSSIFQILFSVFKYIEWFIWVFLMFHKILKVKY